MCICSGEREDDRYISYYIVHWHSSLGLTITPLPVSASPARPPFLHIHALLFRAMYSRRGRCSDHVRPDSTPRRRAWPTRPADQDQVEVEDGRVVKVGDKEKKNKISPFSVGSEHYHLPRKAHLPPTDMGPSPFRPRSPPFHEPLPLPSPIPMPIPAATLCI